MTEGRGRWISVIANLGVLVGLILLVVELRQNRDLMRAQVRHELSTVIHDDMMLIASNPQLASVLRRQNAGEELSPDELVQFHNRSDALFRYWENVHYQYRHDLYDEMEFRSHRDAWAVFMENSPASVTYWCSRRHVYSPAFRQELDGVLPADGCGP